MQRIGCAIVADDMNRSTVFAQRGRIWAIKRERLKRVNITTEAAAAAMELELKKRLEQSEAEIGKMFTVDELMARILSYAKAAKATGPGYVVSAALQRAADSPDYVPGVKKPLKVVAVHAMFLWRQHRTFTEAVESSVRAVQQSTDPIQRLAHTMPGAMERRGAAREANEAARRPLYSLCRRRPTESSTTPISPAELRSRIDATPGARLIRDALATDAPMAFLMTTELWHNKFHADELKLRQKRVSETRMRATLENIGIQRESWPVGLKTSVLDAKQETLRDNAFSDFEKRRCVVTALLERRRRRDGQHLRGDQMWRLREQAALAGRRMLAERGNLPEPPADSPYHDASQLSPAGAVGLAREEAKNLPSFSSAATSQAAAAGAAVARLNARLARPAPPGAPPACAATAGPSPTPAPAPAPAPAPPAPTRAPRQSAIAIARQFLTRKGALGTRKRCRRLDESETAELAETLADAGHPQYGRCANDEDPAMSELLFDARDGRRR